MSTLRRTPPWAILAALLAASTGLRAWAALDVRGPWIAADEVIYSELGRSLYAHGSFSILGQPARFYSLVVPALVGGPLSLHDLALGYDLLRVLQALVVSLTAVPAYLWARSLGAGRFALAAAALTLALPGLAYSGLVMSEVEFLPVLTLAAWALSAALARPTPLRQALLLGAIALAAATRLQALVLVPVLLTALVVKAALDRDLRGALRLWPAVGGIAALAGAYAAWRLSAGGPAGELLGAYRAAGEVGYTVSDAARFSLYHLGDVLLLTAVAPACAVAVLAAGALRGRERSPEVRAYLATGLALVAWLVVEVGTFASRHVGRLAERDLLGLAPVLFVGFAVWLARGAPRPRVAAPVAAAAAVGLVAALPMGRLVSQASIPDAFTTIPLWRLQVHSPGVDLRLVTALAAAAAAAAFALLPRRLVTALCLAALAAISISTSRVVAAQSQLVRLATVGAEARWIDRAAEGPVAFVYSGETNWNAVWFNVFWNRRIDRVYSFVGILVPHLDAPAQPTIGPLPDGRLVLADKAPIAGRDFVAGPSLELVGTPVARAVVPQLTLWRAPAPPRLRAWIQGARVDEHGRTHAYVQVYACRGARLALTLLAPRATRVELKRNDAVVRTVRLRAGETWRGSLVAPPPGRPGGSICTFNADAVGVLKTPALALVGP